MVALTGACTLVYVPSNVRVRGCCIRTVTKIYKTSCNNTYAPPATHLNTVFWYHNHQMKHLLHTTINHEWRTIYTLEYETYETTQNIEQQLKYN